jgi:biopolymer transport protein ExbD
MEGKCLLNRVLVCSLLLSLLAGCGQLNNESKGPELTIDVDGTGSCLLRGTTVDCEQVADYMRDTMKVPLQTYIAVSPSDQNTNADSITPVMHRLKEAGFTAVIGSIGIRPNKPLQPTARENAPSG